MTTNTQEPYDLRAFFRAVGTSMFGSALSATPVERKESGVEVEMLGLDTVHVTCAPMDVAAFVDGVQSAIVVTHQGHRPVYLAYQAAGAVGPNASLIGMRDRLMVVCSHLDIEYVATVNPPESPLPVQALPAESPPEIERAAHLSLGQGREQLERALVEDLVAAGTHPVIVDGSLMARPYQMGLFGVVKDTTSTKYLADERCLFGLPAGWRSPVFKLPAGSQGCRYDRFSAYLRLHDATNRGWSHGLIRLESFTEADIDPLAARAMAERQSPRSGDGRWDRHLASVATTEKVLRALRPTVFNF